MPFLMSSYVEPATLKQQLRLQIDWLQKVRTHHYRRLIYYFGSFCAYYVPRDYVIPQAMPHVIPQTHSSFYPHRFRF